MQSASAPIGVARRADEGAPLGQRAQPLEVVLGQEHAFGDDASVAAETAGARRTGRGAGAVAGARAAVARGAAPAAARAALPSSASTAPPQAAAGAGAGAIAEARRRASSIVDVASC